VPLGNQYFKGTAALSNAGNQLPSNAVSYPTKMESSYIVTFITHDHSIKKIHIFSFLQIFWINLHAEFCSSLRFFGTIFSCFSHAQICCWNMSDTLFAHIQLLCYDSHAYDDDFFWHVLTFVTFSGCHICHSFFHIPSFFWKLLYAFTQAVDWVSSSCASHKELKVLLS
jgi:hypothetical protein